MNLDSNKQVLFINNVLSGQTFGRDSDGEFSQLGMIRRLWEPSDYVCMYVLGSCTGVGSK